MRYLPVDSLTIPVYKGQLPVDFGSRHMLDQFSSHKFGRKKFVGRHR